MQTSGRSEILNTFSKYGQGAVSEAAFRDFRPAIYSENGKYFAKRFCLKALYLCACS